MPNNINISSGSDFSKKKFGSITKLTKPAFVHNGKVFSDNIFKNQRTIPLLENNTYYVNHGLTDPYTIYEEIIGFFNLENYMGMSVSEAEELISFIQSLNNTNSIAQRASLSSANALLSTLIGASSQTSIGANPSDPYDNNPPDPPQCDPI